MRMMSMPRLSWRYVHLFNPPFLRCTRHYRQQRENRRFCFIKRDFFLLRSLFVNCDIPAATSITDCAFVNAFERLFNIIAVQMLCFLLLATFAGYNALE
jgi:hypothetical protein